MLESCWFVEKFKARAGYFMPYDSSNSARVTQLFTSEDIISKSVTCEEVTHLGMLQKDNSFTHE